MNKRERQDMKELKNLERFDNSHSNRITRYKDILPIIASFVILIALFILYIVIDKVLLLSTLLFLGIWIMVGLLSFLMSYYCEKTSFNDPAITIVLGFLTSISMLNALMLLWRIMINI